VSTLVLEQVCVARGQFPIVVDVDLRVPGGEVTLVLGANGAGKTTLLEAISGILPVKSGSITLDGDPIHRASRVRRARRGLAHVEQGRAVFSDLTVAENLLIATSDGNVEAAFETFPELANRRGIRAGSLSGGEQQMLVLARALLAKPSVLLVDELSLGLAPIIVRRLMPVVRALADSGMAVLMVEQYAALALEIGDSVSVLARGRVVFSGACDELDSHGGVLHGAYLGV
jgi:branched-chain amino acid transport system ATP-binding protein